MKKIFMMLPLFAAILMTGCNSDDSLGASEGQGIKKETVSFNATIDNDEERITFNENDGRKVYWEEDDAVLVVSNTDDSRYIYEVNKIYDNQAQAYFSPQVEGEGLAPGETGKAYYPTTILGDDGKLVLPAVVNFAPEHKISDITPMYADITEDNLSTPAHFSNLCGLLRININGPATGVNTVKRITVTADEPMSGEFEIQEANGTYVAVLKPQTGNPGITLECETPVTLSPEEYTSFYIAVPEGEYHHVTVTTISDNDNAEAFVKTLKAYKDVEQTQENSLTISRNTRYNMTYTVSYKEQPILLTGVYKVGEDKFVQFTRGNLFYNGTTFGLEPHQYSTQPEQPKGENERTVSRHWTIGHLSHFWWSETVAEAVDLMTKPSYSQTHPYSRRLVPLFTNGTDPTFNVYGRKDLRVLEAFNFTDQDGNKEWESLFTYQQYDEFMSTAQGPLLGYYGIAVYPYGWEKDVDGKIGDAALDTWAEIDAAGILFLPATGVRDHKTNPDMTIVSNVSGHLRYLGAISRYSNSSAILTSYGPFQDSLGGALDKDAGHDGRFAMSIRLVKDCPAPQLDGMTEKFIKDEGTTELK